ncbi:MAG: fibrillarin-like rRNA/tRNA 2'-O-methyltransferase [Candidatus Micrarchaeia archaeon]
MKVEEIFPGVFKIDGKLATKNLTPGYSVYGEKTVKIEGEEYRFWDPYRSKLGAAIACGLKELPVKPGDNVLYLGAASGTTASHVSDIVGPKGIVFCIDFAPKVVRDLIKVCEKKQNMLPILADARKPKEYRRYIKSVECIFEDVAQPDQVRILVMNAKEYLKKGDPAMIAIKSQSIDVTRSKKDVFKESIEEASINFDVMEFMQLDPFEKDHLFLSLRFKG